MRSACPSCFYEPQVDDALFELPEADAAFAVEYLPGQFDQRADSAARVHPAVTGGERPAVLSAKVYLLEGELDEAALEAIKRSVITPSRPARPALRCARASPPTIPSRRTWPCSRASPRSTAPARGPDGEHGPLAMDADDAEFCRAYFAGVGRDPTVTEIRVLDTYWSDHCRHTTFGTIIDSVEIEDLEVRESYENYLRVRRELGREDRPVTLMDLATIGAKYLKAKGALRLLDESEEINACSIHITVDNDGTDEPWLLMFKNETQQPPDGDRALRRRGHLHRRRDTRPALRPGLRLPGHAHNRRGRPHRPA